MGIYITKNKKKTKNFLSSPFFYHSNLTTLKGATCRCHSIFHFFFILDFFLGLGSSFALSSSSFFFASASARALAIFLGLVGSLSNKYWAKVATGSGGLYAKQKKKKKNIIFNFVYTSTCWQHHLHVRPITHTIIYQHIQAQHIPKDLKWSVQLFPWGYDIYRSISKNPKYVSFLHLK